MNFRKSSFLGALPPVVKNLLIINVLLWLASFVVPGAFLRFGLNIDLHDILGMHYWQSDKFNATQLITYAFMHSTQSFTHILFNMFALYMFGTILEHVWGPKRFLFYYLATAVGAALVQQAVWTFEFYPLVSAVQQSAELARPDLILPHETVLRDYFSFENILKFTPTDLEALNDMFRKLLNSSSFITIGASGSVFGLLLAFGWLFPEERLFLMFIPVPIKARIFVLIYGVAELFMGVTNAAGDNVAHFAHLGGMLFGALLILYWKQNGNYR